MQLKEIIKNACLMLGKGEVVKYLESEIDDGYDDGWYEDDYYPDYGDGEFGESTNSSTGTDTLETVNLMVNLANLVINELACTYIPLITQEQVFFSNGKAFYKNFNKKAVKILGVYTLSGNALDFADKTEYVMVSSKINETLIIEYQYTPNNYALNDEIGYTEKDVSARVIAYGVASEICISEGNFDQAVMHHKRYVDEISLLTMPKNATIKQRSWR